jgi:hypothetical protein
MLRLREDARGGELGGSCTTATGREGELGGSPITETATEAVEGVHGGELAS